MITPSNLQQELFFQPKEAQFYYYMVLQPGEPVFSACKELKNYCGKLFGSNYAIKNPPHITLGGFVMQEKFQNAMRARLESGLAGLGSPQLITSDLRIFKGSNVIYISLATESASRFGRKLMEDLALAGFIKKKADLVSELHITIVKDLGEEILDLLYDQLKPFEFPPIEFSCPRLILMKQDTASGMKHKVAAFDLEHL